MNLPIEVNAAEKETRYQHPGLSYSDFGRAGKIILPVQNVNCSPEKSPKYLSPASLAMVC